MIGQPNKKYGLTLPKKVQAQTRARPVQPKKLPGAGFSLENDDDPDELDDLASKQSFNTMLKARSERAQKQIDQAQKAALADDPSIYDYDGVYDDMQADKRERTRQAAAQATQEKKSSRYIGSLMKAAELRKQEQDRFYERRLAKERKDEDEEFQDKDVFVTSAYKKKLMEMKKWDTIDKLEEEAEKRQEKVGMDAFFSNLMSNNIATGADVKKTARSAYTAGSAVNERFLNIGTGQSAQSAQTRESEEERRSDAMPEPSSEVLGEAGGEKRGREDYESGQEGEGGKRNRGDAEVKAEAETKPVVDPVEVQRQKDEAIRNARERFLARRREGGSNSAGGS